jgi:hypothetical protein
VLDALVADGLLDSSKPLSGHTKMVTYSLTKKKES